VFHPIHEGNTIGRAVTVGRFLGMRVAMIFLWLRAARQDQPGVRPARPFAVTTGVAQVGWVTPLLAGTRRRAPDLHYCTGQGHRHQQCTATGPGRRTRLGELSGAEVPGVAPPGRHRPWCVGRIE
jgi:hypothetical protein